MNVDNLSHMIKDESHVTSETAEQIMALLDQLERSGRGSYGEGGGGGGGDGVMVHCRTCTGELLTV